MYTERTSGALAYSVDTAVARLVSRSSTTEITNTGSLKREAAAVSDYHGAKREPLSYYFRTSVSLKLTRSGSEIRITDSAETLE